MKIGADNNCINQLFLIILTTDNVQQALDRAGDKGNKGSEAALALLEMIAIRQNIK